MEKTYLVILNGQPVCVANDWELALRVFKQKAIQQNNRRSKFSINHLSRSIVFLPNEHGEPVQELTMQVWNNEVGKEIWLTIHERLTIKDFHEELKRGDHDDV